VPNKPYGWVIDSGAAGQLVLAGEESGALAGGLASLEPTDLTGMSADLLLGGTGSIGEGLGGGGSRLIGPATGALVGPGLSSASKDRTTVYSGDVSLRYDFAAGGDPADWQGFSTNDPVVGPWSVSLRPGVTYKLRMAIRVSSIAGAAACRLTLDHSAAAPGTVVSSKVIPFAAANAWQIAEWVVKVPTTAGPNSLLSIQFQRGTTAATSFWVDSIRSEEVGVIYDNGTVDSATFTVDLANGTHQRITKGTVNIKVGLALSNPVSGVVYVLELHHSSPTTAGGFNMPSNFVYLNDTPLGLTNVAGHSDVLAFVYDSIAGVFYQVAEGADEPDVAVQTATGSFSITTAAAGSTQAITSVGFQPVAVIFWWNDRTSSGGPTAQAWRIGMGWAAAPNTGFCVHCLGVNAVATSDEQHRLDNANCIGSITNAQAVDGAAVLQSFDPDGFTIKINTQFTNSLVVGWLALGGSPISVKAGSFTMRSGTGTQAVQGVGFKPGWALFLTGNDAGNAPPVTRAASHFSFGGASNYDGSGTQGSGVAAIYCQDVVTSPTTRHYCVHANDLSSDCITVMGAALISQAQVTSFDSDGFTLNWSAQDTVLRTVFYLAVSGPRAKFYNMLSNVSAPSTPAELVDVTFRPKADLLWSCGDAFQTIGGANANDAKFNIGCWANAGTRQKAAVVQTCIAAQNRNFASAHVTDCTESYQPGDCYTNHSSTDTQAGLITCSDVQPRFADYSQTVADTVQAGIVTLRVGA